MSETKLSSKTVVKGRSHISSLINGTDFVYFLSNNSADSGTDGVALFAKRWTRPRFARVELQTETDSEGRYVSASFLEGTELELRDCIFVYAPNCGREFKKLGRRVAYEEALKRAFHLLKCALLLGDINALWDLFDPKHVR